ncbi:MAG: tyrosine--tRNA ligase [Clostridiales bacterium]|nr:tyrosine--tRNA ligase [Clostridiales bacterium]
MNNVWDILEERDYIEQATFGDELKEWLGKEKTTFYIGFDPTADSLHVGHFISLMVASHMQKAGHTPILLIGGGTAMIGDPSGKTDMRKMLTKEEINHNVECFKVQMSKFLSFEGENKARIVNNADWLLDLNYVEFIRDIGVHFSVNRMLTAECFKQRLERGLSFLEFNYMLMQSYDFLELFNNYGCRLELGGNDQWSNILGGVELIRKVKQTPAFGLTFKLLTNSEGKKMGKTVSGALWLDPNKTSPYEFYQYWMNINDADVKKVLSLLTFLPMDEVNRLSSLEGSEINQAKKVAAYEITKIVHGEDEANKAKEAAEALFGQGGDISNMPTTQINKADFTGNILDVLVITNLAPSKSQARTLIAQGGISVNDIKITDINHIISEDDFTDGYVIVKKGKKVFHKVELI